MKEITIYQSNIAQAEKKLGETKVLFLDREEGILFLQVGTCGLKYFVKTNTAIHSCQAINNNRPCYHLGALYLHILKEGMLKPPVKSNSKKAIATFNVEAEEVAAAELAAEARRWEEEKDRKLLLQKQEKMLQEHAEMENILQEIRAGEDEVLKKLSYILPWRILKLLKKFRDEQAARLTEEQKSRIPKLKYIPSDNEFTKALAALLHPVWSAPLLVGPKGTGKSTLAESLAAALNLPVVKIFGGIDVNAEGLLGGKTLVPVENRVDTVTEMKLRAVAKQAGVDIEPILRRLKEVQLRVGFEPGILLRAVLGGEMVVMEEVNMLPPDVTSLLHGLLDWSRKLSIPGYGIVTAPVYFRLVGCINPDYAGTKELNEAFEDRFRLVEIPFPKNEVLLEILLHEAGIDEGTARVMVEIFDRIRNRVENGDLSTRALSFRRLLRAAEDIKLGVDEPLNCVISNLVEGLDEVEKNILQEIIKDYRL